MPKLRSYRAKRILDLTVSSSAEDTPSKRRKYDQTTFLNNNDPSNQESRKSSPIPDGFQEELIQLEDLLGDVFKSNEIENESQHHFEQDQELRVVVSNGPSNSITVAPNDLCSALPETTLQESANLMLNTDASVATNPLCAKTQLQGSLINEKDETTDAPSNKHTQPTCNELTSFTTNIGTTAPTGDTASLLRKDITERTPLPSRIENTSTPETTTTGQPTDLAGITTTETERTEAAFPALLSTDFDHTPVPSPLSHAATCSDEFCPICEEKADDIPILADDDLYGNLPTPSISSLASSNVTPTSSKSNRKKTFKQDKGKKRLVHKENWSVVQRKALKNLGKSFTDKNDKKVPEKKLKSPCKCRRKCSDCFATDVRSEIFNKFWRLGDRARQWEYVIKYTKKIPKRRMTTEETLHDRQNTFIYFLPRGDKKIKVCKTMFLNTISCGERIITTAWKKYDGDTAVEADKRGKYKHKPKVIDEEMIRSVCDHVNSFSLVESHYTRQNSKKLYLEGVESISRMYKLYSEWYDPEKYRNKANKKRQYLDIVNKNFNLAFHKPKKDQCDICHIFSNNPVPSQKEKDAYMEHMARKKIARELKLADKIEAKSNPEVVAATFDFEKVLVTPHGEVSVFYYKRKLATLNFTVYNLSTKDATCYMWHEGIAKRGSNEVSSCLYKFIKEHAAKGVKEFRFWSDNCTGQNRNRIVFSLYLLAAKEFGVTIIHRFLEKGHTQNEGDSVHSTIERASNRKFIYVPEEWYCLVRWAKAEGNPYIVEEIKGDEIHDFKSLLINKNWAKNTSNQKIQWTQIKEVKVQANAYDRIEYRYNLNEESETVRVLRSRTRNTDRNTREFELKEAYDGPLPITQDKYKDLNTLCQSGIIPEKYHGFYKNLPYTKKNSRNENQNDESEDTD